VPRVRQNISSLAKGELSELFEGRIDLEQYNNGAKTLENVIVLEQGPGQRRPGTRYVCATKFPALFSRSVRYVSSKVNAYHLEVGEGYIRFFKNNVRIESGGVPVEIATPYVAADLDTLVFSQLNDVLFITSLFYQQRRLERYSDTVWQLRLEPIDVPASYVYGVRPASTLTPSATSGAGVTFTASVAQFEAGDVGRELLIIAGTNIGARALITGFTSTTIVTATISQNFTNTSANAATDWKITESPKTDVTPSAKSPVGVDITLTAVLGAWRAGDVGKFVQINGGLVQITSITSNIVVHGTLRSELNSVAVAASDTWTLEENAWSTSNGFPACDEFRDERHYYAGTLAQPQTGWGSKVNDISNFAVGVLASDAVQFTISNSQLNPIVWMRSIKHLIVGTTNGEFRVFGSQDQVITPTNITIDPQTPNGSTDDVQPITVGNVILYVTASTRRLREEVFDYVVDGYKSADIIILSQHLTRDFGIRELGYQREPTPIIWAPRDDGTMLTCTYIRDQNVVAWARQITGSAVQDPAVPEHTIPGDGFYESHAIIPHPNGDREQVWVTVRRVVNGATTRYIEFFDDSRFYYRQLHTDAAVTIDGTGTTTLTLSATSGPGVTATSGAPFFVAGDVGHEIRLVGSGSRATITAFNTSTSVTVTVTKVFPSVGPYASGAWGVARADIPGLSHLEGKTVNVIVDGAPTSNQVVVAGAITAQFKGIKVEVGLPFISTVDPVRPEFAGPTGTVQGLPKIVPELTVRLFESLGFTVNGESIEDFRIEGDVQDSPPTPVTGDILCQGILGWSTDGRVRLQQTQPLPFTLTMMTNTVVSSS
jgi:hypothetical protein